MWPRLEIILLAVAALALGACSNEVYSAAPLLAEATQPGDPVLRPGLWDVGFNADATCKPDFTRPRAAWPDCMVGVVVQDHQAWMVSRQEKVPLFRYRLAPGVPALLQRRWFAEVLKDPRNPAQDGSADRWYYAGLKVLKTDAEGRIVEARTWAGECGPIPPVPLGAHALTVTDHAFPGLTMGGAFCTAPTLEAARGAVTASESLPGGGVQTLRWVRDAP